MPFQLFFKYKVLQLSHHPVITQTIFYNLGKKMPSLCPGNSLDWISNSQPENNIIHYEANKATRPCDVQLN